MRHNILDVENHLPEKTDKYYMDTNILIYLFYNFYSHPTFRTKYSNFYKEIISSGAKLFISSLTLCEFINFCLRKVAHSRGFDTYKKEFRKTQYYKDTVEEIELIVNNILKSFNRINDNFENTNIEDLFINLKHSDFNDEYIFNLCLQNDFKLITNDADCKNVPQNLVIVTANTKV